MVLWTANSLMIIGTLCSGGAERNTIDKLKCPRVLIECIEDVARVRKYTDYVQFSHIVECVKNLNFEPVTEGKK